MALHRKRGAPRLIEWTGERCVPWAPDIQVIYEHFHRYLWAVQLAAGKRVLDLASGEGFGAALLAERAAEVIGVDIDETSIRHAQLNYARENLAFRFADARDLGSLERASFDVVVAFELIEHIDEQQAVLDQIKRVLVPGGLLIVSTPERSAYDSGRDGENPFHVRELARDEFDELLEANFTHRRMWAQHVASGSELRAIDAAGVDDSSTADVGVDASSFLIEQDGDEWRPTEALPLLYMIALASDAELPSLPRASSLGDAHMALTSSRLAELADRLNGEIQKREDEIGARGEAIRTLEADRAVLRERLDGSQDRYQRLASEAFAARNAYAAHMAQRELQFIGEHRVLSAAMADDLARANAHIEYLSGRLAWLEASLVWRGTLRIKNQLIALLGGEESTGLRVVRRVLRLLYRFAGTTAGLRAAAVPSEPGPGELPEPEAGGEPEVVATAIEFEPIVLERAEQPLISIVMPLYAGAEHTHRALQTIRDNTFYTRYEVILVNDGDDPATAALLDRVSGARVLTNDENIGYLRSVNRGAAVARGRWLVLANNDIEVLPNWAAELLDCGESADDIAIVTPMYLQPDGMISEAGGIIWNDASGHNYGRGDAPDKWRYRWRREVDYGSAAALLVRTDVWRELGGYDERFRPMYYEDADLCFAARALGYRVMYEPNARVLHNEGSSAGTDENVGHKRHQALNRPKFADKWAEVLASDHLPRPDGPDNSWAGATARRGRRVLFIDHRIPFWDREAGALRALALIKELLARGHHITFMPDNGANTEPYTTELQRLGVEVMYGHELSEQLSILIAPHLEGVIVSRPQIASRYLALLRRHAPQALLIYDTVDLHWLREARQAAHEADHDGETLMTPEVLWTKGLELAVIGAADVTLVATEPDRARVEADVPDVVVKVVGTINPVRHDVPGLAGRAGVVLVGGFQHRPNIDAALRLVNCIMPAVWEKLPDVTVQIIGPDAPPEIEALASDRVNVLGWVADVEPYLDVARVTVAPLSFGAGMKGKITQALAMGLPVVTTPVGAEGIGAASGEQLMIGTDDAALAELTISVLTDDVLWQQLADAGRELAARLCAPELAGQLLETILVEGTRRAQPATSGTA